MTDTFLARGHVDLDNDAIIAKCYDFLQNHTLTDVEGVYGKLDGRLSTVIMAIYLNKNNLSHLMPHNWIELTPLVDAIKEQSKCNHIERSWFNVLPSDTDLGAHSHIHSKNNGATYGSFVYYPKVVEDDSQIELLLNGEWTTITVQTGDWICFGLDCVHRVPKNKTDHHRISIVFNV
jgi:hypothetical protein